jgi:O-antigen ligase
LAFPSEQPLCWAFGSGFGSINDFGEAAHNLALQIVFELGLVGLRMVGTMFSALLRMTWRMNFGNRGLGS